MTRTYINPPKCCDYCSQTLTDIFYDSKTVFGPWANLCPHCFKEIGVGVGMGCAQKYAYNEESRTWIKQD